MLSFMLDGDDCLSVRDGRLFVEGCDAPDLLERFGSPLFVVSESRRDESSV